MLKDFIKKNYTSQASYVEYGYGQVEPNHLSAQRTGQIYAQLPANKDITVLEQGQFVKYDYAAANGGEVNFTGAGEWMLVYNEIKLYREHQMDCEFAMVKDNYEARIYSPYDWEQPEVEKQARYYNGVDNAGNDSITLSGPTTYQVAAAYDASASYFSDSEGQTPVTIADAEAFAAAGTLYVAVPGDKTYYFDDVTAGPDPYELHYNEDPYHFLGRYHERRMPEGTKMVPRVFKTNVGDIFTTNTINAETLALGDLLTPGADGILEVGSGDMQWQVVRVYTMPDGQKGVKLMRIK